MTRRQRRRHGFSCAGEQRQRPDQLVSLPQPRVRGNGLTDYGYFQQNGAVALRFPAGASLTY